MGNKLILLLALLALGGLGYYLWGKVGEAPKEATLPGYTNALKADEQKAKAAAATANLGAVQEAVNKYHAEKGVYPSALQDLAPAYLDHVPEGLQYDASTGAVSVAQ